MTNETKRAAGYVRVSTQGQVKEGESLNQQRKAISTYTEAHGWELIQPIYEDAGISGAKQDRPALQRLLSDAEARKFDSVVTYQFARFGRSLRDLLDNMERLEKAGIPFISIQDGIDFSTNTGKLARNILMSIAEWDRERIRETMSTNKLARWKEFRTLVGRPPYAYRWNKETKTLEIIPEEKEVYLRLVDDYLSGLSFADIAAKLKGEGIKCKRAGWSTSTISFVLKSPAHYGHLVVNQHKYDGDQRTGDLKPTSEHIIFPCPPIISKTLWDRVQAKTQANRVKGKNIHAGEPYWLRDVLVCGECGGRIKPHHGQQRKDGSGLRYYACFWKGTSQKQLDAKGRKRCPLPYIKAEELEEQVWNEVVTRLFIIEDLQPPDHSPSWLVDPARYDRMIIDLKGQGERLEKDLQGKERAKERLFRLLESPDCNEGDFRSRLELLTNEALTIQGRLEEIQGDIQKLEQGRQNDKALAEFLRDKRGLLQDIYRELSALPNTGKKDLIEALLDGPIEIWGAGEGPWTINARRRFDPTILKRFVSPKVMGSLDSNGSHHLKRIELLSRSRI